MRIPLCCVLAALLLAPASASAHDGGSIQHKNEFLRSKVQKLHGDRAPGRDIVSLDLRGGQKPSARQIRRYFNAMRRMLMPAPAAQLVTTGKPYRPPARTATVQAGGVLERIASCESGGDPTAVSSTGQYRGKYQFDRSTWGTVGGSGDPAAAPEWEQDKRAAMLLAKRGTSPWPICG